MNDITITFSSTTGNSSTKYVVDIDLFLSSLIPLRVYLLFKLYSFYSPGQMIERRKFAMNAAQVEECPLLLKQN